MKQKYSKVMVVVYIAIAIFILSACRRGGSNQPDGRQDLERAAVQGIGYSIGHVDVLTISAPAGSLPLLQQSADNLQQALPDYISLEIVFADYTPENANSHANLLLSQFAAGTGPDIIMRDYFPLHSFIEHGFLADIYTIIDSSNFTREDFFTSVLEGAEVDGRLYMLPLSFNIDYIGINANAPSSILSSFAALDYATPANIAELFLNLQNYPEWADFNLIRGLNAADVFLPELNNAISITGRTANFQNLVNTMDNIRLTFEGNQRFATQGIFNWQRPADDFVRMQEQYLFSRISGSGAGVYSLFEFSEPFFVHHIPLANESGRLVNNFGGMQMAVSYTANPNLVMAFFAQVMLDSLLSPCLQQSIPILTGIYRQSLDASFRHALSQITLPSINGNENAAISQAIDRISEYSTWASVTPYSNFLMPELSVLDTFFDFLQGDMSAVEAADEMAAITNEWLGEDRQEIQEYVHIAAADITDLPVRVLTIRADNRHVEVIRQATQAINNDWRERGITSTLQVDIQSHRWYDRDGEDERRERLATELASGFHAPDIFLFNPLEHDIHTKIAEGHLQNIYTLMDNCSNTSLDEFFIHVLQAYEINNGLYMFPINFGFEYVSVNTYLAPDFVERFRRMDFISLVELMEMYIDLMNTHGTGFRQLSFANSGRMTVTSNSILRPLIYEFIDLNTRTSNITDPRFVQMLELIVESYRVNERGWNRGANIITTELLREYAEDTLFFINNTSAPPFEAFFTPVTPVFAYSIPLTDTSGRLLLDSTSRFGQGWAVVCVTHTADGALAWEFIRHLIYAYANPGLTGNALTAPSINNVLWLESLTSPIKRAYFYDSVMNTFELIYRRWGPNTFQRSGIMQLFVGMAYDDDESRQLEAAVSRIASYNEFPVTRISPLIPGHLMDVYLYQLRNGEITAEDAAQRMHIAVQAWLED